MIPVIEVLPGHFVRAAGNPRMLSLDGEVVAPLATILADSWTDEDRAKFGVFMAEPFETPAGKVKVGQARYERQGDNVVEVYDTEPEPAPKVLTVEDKLARIGLTLAELKAALS